MEIKIHFNHMEPSDAVETVIKDKVVRLKKYFEGRFSVSWNCSVEKGVHTSNVTVHGKNLDINAHADSDSLYKTIDIVMDKIEKQIAKRKDVLTNKHHEKFVATL